MMCLRVSGLPAASSFELFTTRYTCFHSFQPFFCSANCNEKIAAPRRTRVTKSTKICRTSLVARYAAPPCVTRYAATYIASTVVLRVAVGGQMHGNVSSRIGGKAWSTFSFLPSPPSCNAGSPCGPLLLFAKTARW